MCEAMKDKLGRQQYEIVIQAAANGKIVARETLKVLVTSICSCFAGVSVQIPARRCWNQFLII